MTDSPKIRRRALLSGGASLAAAIGAGSLAAATPLTPPNPEGPFYPSQPQLDRDTDLTRVEGRAGRAQGEVLRVTGKVLDEEGRPVEGALVDIWQANCHGRYRHENDPSTAPLDPDFQGWGMVRTDANGGYAFTTIKPGAYNVDGEWRRPPHIHFKVSRRGYHELTTQMYFAGEALNDGDRLLRGVPEAQRGLLVVEFSSGADGTPSGHFPIVLARVV